jgi:hypothetical protein
MFIAQFVNIYIFFLQRQLDMRSHVNIDMQYAERVKYKDLYYLWAGQNGNPNKIREYPNLK